MNGASDYSSEDAERFRLNDTRSQTMRDYYLYLWGLPMKLKDAGTIIHETVEKVHFENNTALKLQVTYEETTGQDTWYFYIDPVTYRMVGYQFFHDESINDGEYITLGEPLTISGMRIPNDRSWYVNKDSTYLGTDRITYAGVLAPHH